VKGLGKGREAGEYDGRRKWKEGGGEEGGGGEEKIVQGGMDNKGGREQGSGVGDELKWGG